MILRYTCTHVLHSAVNAPLGPWARTLLMEASVAGQAPCAAHLLSQGAQVNKVKGAWVPCVWDTQTRLLTIRRRQVDADGSTALHLASAAGHDPVVHILLYYNADVFLLDGSVSVFVRMHYPQTPLNHTDPPSLKTAGATPRSPSPPPTAKPPSSAASSSASSSSPCSRPSSGPASRSRSGAARSSRPAPSAAARPQGTRRRRTPGLSTPATTSGERPSGARRAGCASGYVCLLPIST